MSDRRSIWVSYLALFIMSFAFADAPAAAQRRGHRSGGAHRAQRQSIKRQKPAHRPQSTKSFDTAGDRGVGADRGRDQSRQVNVDNRGRDVNVNVDRSQHVEMNRRNTAVRANPRPYARAPYRYGGRSYYAHNPYHYHGYRPYSWGPSWHPWGFVVATVAATAIVVSVNNQKYHYDNGVYYSPSDGGYTVVAAPVGATITTLPQGAQTVKVDETTNNYYYGGTYYEKSGSGYTVVPPTAGTVVESLPEGGKEVQIGDQTYVQVGDTYYQPIQRDGKNMYEVVEVKSE